MYNKQGKELKRDIELVEYTDNGKFELTGEKVSTYTLSRSMSTENMASLLSDFLNVGMKDYREGAIIGECFQTEHRSLQGSAIRFALGIIIGMADQDYTDGRNEVPVAMAKEIKAMIENGALKMGWLV